jgi:hypothetical protein
VPIRKSRIHSLRSHWPVCEPERPAAISSFQIKNTVWLFTCITYG